jgi:alcohol dehydrogenase
MVDLDDRRLAMAKRFGATATLYKADGKAVERITKMTDGRGVGTVVEAVGVAAIFELCESIVAPGGTIATIGVQGTKVALHPARLWERNMTITTRLLATVGTPMLRGKLRSRRLGPEPLITCRFALGRVLDASETFRHAANTRALKVVIGTSRWL